MKPVDQPTITRDFGAAHPALLQSHLPSLDGMRAISIVLVLVAHGT
jgi:peptidoglycan/LPS O-acetylase OafA/YrhL